MRRIARGRYNRYVDTTLPEISDITCHKLVTPVGGHVSVTAGEKMNITWNSWPASHHGPIIYSLAHCHGYCGVLDREYLQFLTIDGSEHPFDSTHEYQSTHPVRDNSFSWLVQTPADIPSGNYVLRHEVVVRGQDEQQDGFQFYPQSTCFNIAVTGTGTIQPASITKEAKLSQDIKPGIFHNFLYNLTGTFNRIKALLYRQSCDRSRGEQAERSSDEQCNRGRGTTCISSSIQDRYNRTCRSLNNGLFLR